MAKCWSYHPDGKPDAFVWVEWPTTGRPKGAFKCRACWDAADKQDFWGNPAFNFIEFLSPVVMFRNGKQHGDAIYSEQERT